MIIQIIGKKNSKSCNAISTKADIQRYTGQKVDAIINYGLSGEYLELYFKKYPLIKNIPIINKNVGQSKYSSVKYVEQNGVLVPETKLFLSKTDKISDWIEKRIYSSQGIGITAATKREKILGKYYQMMIKDRLYELRVHTFLWVPKKDWAVHKRTGPVDQIAWNFHQGGHFSSYGISDKVLVEAKNISEKVLCIIGMSFGAVDFIVDTSMKIYFLEINSSPGFSEFSEDIYFNAMKKLKLLSVNEIIKFSS